MGLRFRKSVKVAPGVRINFGKKGSSVTFGKRGAKVTVGKNGVRTTVGLPGTGLSYTKYYPNDKKKMDKQTQSTATINNIEQNSMKQMERETAFKILKWAFYVFLAFLVLMMAKDSPAVWFGVLIILLAAVLKRLGQRNVIKLKKTWYITFIGWILTLVLWVSGIEPSDQIENPNSNEPNNNLISTPIETEKENNNENIHNEDNPSESETVVNEEIKNNEENPNINEPPTEPIPVTNPNASEMNQEINNQAESQPAVQQEYYANCSELNKVYSSGVPADHPAYRARLDKDKDGWACER